MKRQESLTIKQHAMPPDRAGLSPLPAGVLLLTGFWGTAWQWLSPAQGAWGLISLLLAAGIFLVPSLLFRPEKRPHRIAALCALAALAAAAIIFRDRLPAAAAGIGNLAKQRLFLQTGRYRLPYEAAGDIRWLLLPAAALSGAACGAGLRLRYGRVGVSLVGMVLPGLQICGLLPGGWFPAVYLTGTLLCFVRERPKKRWLISAAALLLALIFAGAAMLPGIVPEDGGAGARALHRLRYEQNRNPLPEGDLTAACPAASNQAALELRMAHWTPLYLRGYVAGEYTGTGWERLPAAALEEDAETLYVLQSDYFSPAVQLAAAWASQETEAENRITLTPLGACREHLFLPYGAATGLPDAADLTGEGSRTAIPQQYEAALYPVEESYLLQKSLSQEAPDGAYRQGEAVYRRWVYDHYLTVPQHTYEVLTQSFSPSQDWTTTQAKAEILRFLTENLTYREGTRLSGTDVAAAALTGSRQGSSVHYATLAALLLRCCGIPARYVEGYAVTRQQAGLLTDGAALTLTERDAHAWAEYYLDGVGWIPFDAAPGYTDLVQYTLPDDGSQAEGGQNSSASAPTQPEQNRTPQISEEPQEEGTHRVFLRNALLAFLLVLIAVLAGLLLRTFLLRHRLRRRRAAYRSGDCRRACAGILCGIHDFLALLAPGRWDAYDAAHEARMASALDSAETAQRIAALEREIWYSGHSISPAQREDALALLAAVEARWRQVTPRYRQFFQRFFTCKVF